MNETAKICGANCRQSTQTYLRRLIFAVMLAAAGSAISATSNSDSKALKCEAGPINEVFGKGQWLVYGCADGRSMVVVSAPGSPAFPFYFMVFEGANGYEVVGEGTGRREATAEAYSDLKALSAEKIKALIAETNRVKK